MDIPNTLQLQKVKNFYKKKCSLSLTDSQALEIYLSLVTFAEAKVKYHSKKNKYVRIK